jgi:hypothetical protein
MLQLKESLMLVQPTLAPINNLKTIFSAKKKLWGGTLNSGLLINL